MFEEVTSGTRVFKWVVFTQGIDFYPRVIVPSVSSVAKR